MDYIYIRNRPLQLVLICSNLVSWEPPTRGHLLFSTSCHWSSGVAVFLPVHISSDYSTNSREISKQLDQCISKLTIFESKTKSKGVSISKYIHHGFHDHEYIPFLNIYAFSTSSTLQTTLCSLNFHSCNPTRTQHRSKNPCPGVRHLLGSRVPSRHCLSSLEEWHASHRYSPGIQCWSTSWEGN